MLLNWCSAWWYELRLILQLVLLLEHGGYKHPEIRSNFVVIKPRSYSFDNIQFLHRTQTLVVNLFSAMFASIWSLLGWKEVPPPPPTPSPPSVTITGVRIPADGTPAHMVQLETITASDATDGFLFHVPDLRKYWRTDLGWHQRDLLRLDLQQDRYAEFIPLSQHLQQKHHLKELLNPRGRADHQRRLHLNQRYVLDQRFYSLPKPFHPCAGTYYVMYSFCMDELPLNSYVPAWIRQISPRCCLPYYGDAFVVKMAPHEYGECEWASYADITPQFLDLLMQGPLTRSTAAL
jgi:hypothetical protein